MSCAAKLRLFMWPPFEVSENLNLAVGDYPNIELEGLFSTYSEALNSSESLSSSTMVVLREYS